MSASLVYTLAGEVHHVPLEAEDVTIGRGSGCTIRFTHDAEISRIHCSVQRRGAGYVVLDAASRNGTFLNDVRCTNVECELKDGDRIRVGKTVLKFVKARGADATAEAIQELEREIESGKGFHTILHEIVDKPAPKK
ncbi:MAG: FHA domain protein [Lentisphaerae bacterium ADurb.BinA184]|nr:MAG: FHA domain protein [Lentisphaerae bacterium ADurb.BinA184]